MNPMQKMKALKRALALVAVLVMAGTGWAAKPGGVGPGIPGDLNGSRDSVDVSVPVVGFASCSDPLPLNTTRTYSVKAYIFQPSGRIFAIGLGFSGSFACSADLNTSQPVPVSVDALPGLTFKPGPATLVYQVIQTTTDNNTVPATVTDTVVYEYGSRVDLH